MRRIIDVPKVSLVQRFNCTRMLISHLVCVVPCIVQVNKKSYKFGEEAYRNGIKRKRDKIGMARMLKLLTPHHTITIIL